MPDAVAFALDPLCPWCYQTSRWARRLEELDVLALTWRTFSLELANAESPEAAAKGHVRSQAALRAIVTAREAEGQAAAGELYRALGDAVHQQGAAVDDHGVLTAALEDAGLPAALLDKALGDPESWERVRTEHDDLARRHGVFGVPTLVLGGGSGPAVFGPVISEPPDDEEAVELWTHVRWLARNRNFSELKRRDRPQPDLQSVRRYVASQASSDSSSA